ncbi:MAG: methionyl-tRNA formyltransferase [Casimicrobiaceae bacterium]
MLRVGFAGTPDFAVTALEAILTAGFAVPLVMTQPDRPQGRGLVTRASPVKAAAQRHGLAILQPATLKTAEARDAALAVPLDVLVVAAYGLILPAAILAWPARGALNIHASLLPRWRGAAPIHRAILAGDAVSGVTIMQMDEGLDTGPMIDRVAVAIEPRETTGSLHDKLAVAGAGAVVRALKVLARGESLKAAPQPAEGTSYAAKIVRSEPAIDWSMPAPAIDRQIRAFSPAPGAYALHDGVSWKIWEAEPIAAATRAPYGTVLAAGADTIVIACGEGALRVSTIQPAGGKRLPVGAVVSGRRIRAGDVFASAPS